MQTPVNATQFVWSFRDQKYGWTEKWVLGALANATQMQAIMLSYLDVRMPLMGTGIWSDYASARQLNNSGISLRIDTNQLSVAPGFTVADTGGSALVGFKRQISVDGTQPDRPYSALLVKWVSAAGNRKNIFLSGVPDDVIVDPFGPTFAASYVTALTAWSTYIKSGPSLGWLSSLASGNQKFPITSIGAGPNAIVTATGGGFGLNSMVKIGGLRGLTGYRGTFFVSSVVGNSFGLQGYDPPAALPRVSSGYIQAVGYSFVPAFQVLGIKEVKKSRGKGSDLPVGRRKARQS